MPIFRLDPVDVHHRDWRASTHHAAAFVRATSERCARVVCMMAFGGVPEIVPGENAPAMPWTQPERATCVRASDGRWPEDGPIELLQPIVHRDILRQQISALKID
jgi:hypothetical protein